MYNSKLICKKCDICQKQATDTHHINEQNLANSKGFITHYHKNNLHNLVPLCEQCHHKVHHGELEIKGYKNTTDGIELDYNFLKSKPNRKKYTMEQIELIHSYKDKENITMKKTKIELKNKYNITISIPIISKIWNNNY